MSKGQIDQERKILCVGLLCLDVVSICESFPVEDSDQRCVERFWQRGGNASNNTTVLSLLKAPCEFMGSIAQSHEKSFFQEDFASHGIDISHCVYHKGCSCSTSFVIINNQNGTRTIINSNRNMPELTFEDFKANIKLDSTKYKWIHFEGRPASEEVRQMLAYVDEYNSTRSMEDRITTSVELEKPRPQLGILFSTADYVFVSKDYARHFGHTNKEDAVAAFLPQCRPGATIICAWGDTGAAAKSWSGTTYSTKAFPPASVVDTLGAGDTFVASTVYKLSWGVPIEEAITFGCKMAGAKIGFRGYDALREVIERFGMNGVAQNGITHVSTNGVIEDNTSRCH